MYIDPNTGGQLFQILAATFAVASGFILIFSGRIRMWWARIKRNRQAKTVDQTGSDSDQNKNS
jgi:hypothetical protein